MKQLIYNLFSILFIICSFCTCCKSREINPPVIYTINNPELKAQIKKYESVNHKKGELGFMLIGIQTIPAQNCTKYHLKYENDTFPIEMGGDFFVMKCDNILAVGYYYGPLIVRAKEGYIWNYLKKSYPEQYYDYLEGVVSAPVTGLSETCVLTFRNGKLMDRQIIIQ